VSSNPRPAILIRPEDAADRSQVRAVLEMAFAREAEAGLVDRLRAEGAFVLHLVAEQTGVVVGAIGFPRLVIERAGADAPAVGLAPLAVMPDWQRQGIGRALIEDGLVRLANRNETLIFVLGDPGYYRRFGFDPDAAAAFESPYSGAHFMLRRLSGEAPTAGRVRYPRAFKDLG
jgi:putative acetyltransferase